MKETFTYGFHDFNFDEYGIEIKVDRFHESRGDWHGFIKIQADPSSYPQLESPHILFQKINLSSGNTRRSLARDLDKMLEIGQGIWIGILETVCTKSLYQRWQGSPVTKIGKLPLNSADPFLLYPILREGSQTVLYGEGGLGKSYCSLLFALLVQYNRSLGKLASKPANVLYLDWEGTQSDLNARCAAMSKGMGFEGEILYRDCNTAFVNEYNTFDSMIIENNVGLVIIDAKTAAINGHINESENTMHLFNALRTLKLKGYPVTALIIDHVAKDSDRGPIGSVTNTNAPRDVWQMKASQQPNSSTKRIGLYHKKANNGKIQKPFGLEFKFQDDDYHNIDTVWVSYEEDIDDDSEGSKQDSLHEQINEILKENHKIEPNGDTIYIPMSADEIYNKIGGNLSSIRARLADANYRNILWERATPGQYRHLPKPALSSYWMNAMSEGDD